MKKLILVSAAIAALAASPLAAFAQDGNSSSTGQKMKGPPNANGYGKDQGRSSSEDTDKSNASGKVKGPPNANGASSGDSK